MSTSTHADGKRPPSPFSRRDFLKTAGAASAGALLAGCDGGGGTPRPTPTSILTPGIRHTMAASILSGAAVCMPDIILAPTLSPHLRAARDLYQTNPADFEPGVQIGGGSCNGSVEGSSCTPDPLDPWGGEETTPYTLDEPYVNAVKGYEHLVSGLSPDCVFLSKVRELLTASGKLLPLGGDMADLSPAAVSAAIQSEFKKPVIEVDEPPELPSPDIGKLTFFAPAMIDFRPKKLKCIKTTDERSSDEIIWYSNTCYIQNIQEVVGDIEEFIDGGSVEGFNINAKWKTASWMSSVIGGIDDGDTHTFGPQNYMARNIPISKGFCPVSGNMVLFENDDQEYNAVQETIINYESYVVNAFLGEYIAWMASSMIGAACIPGYQVVPSLAAVVIGASVLLAVTACAVVDIVNFFDRDDRIGNYQWHSTGEYIDIEDQTIMPFEGISIGSNKGHYKIDYEVIHRGREVFYRNFVIEREVASRFFTLDDNGEREYHTRMHHYDKDGLGEKGDDILYFPFINQPHHIEAQAEIYWDLKDVPSEQGNRHAEWVDRPTDYYEQGDEYLAKGKVHWGLHAGWHKINYYPVVESWRFIRQR